MKSGSKRLIFVPTDFSEVCDNALSHGAEIAAFLDYKVKLIHIINKDTRSFLKKEDLELGDLEKKLEELASTSEEKYQVDTSYITAEGSIFSTIGEIIENEENSELIILGTHGKVGFQRLIGSYALKVVSNSPVPVIVVQKRPFGHGYKNIVFPIAGFMEDRQKVKWAVYLARTFKSHIHLFLKHEIDPRLLTRINIISSQISEEFDNEEIPYTITRMETKGNFADQIIDYSASKLADLIMIMTETEIPAPDVNVSPWVEKLIFNTSQIPVMCMNPLALSKFYYPM
jgi:nucleotide-binding universal stress UspA family protein